MGFLAGATWVSRTGSGFNIDAMSGLLGAAGVTGAPVLSEASCERKISLTIGIARAIGLIAGARDSRAGSARKMFLARCTPDAANVR